MKANWWCVARVVFILAMLAFSGCIGDDDQHLNHCNADMGFNRDCQATGGALAAGAAAVFGALNGLSENAKEARATRDLTDAALQSDPNNSRR